MNFSPSSDSGITPPLCRFRRVDKEPQRGVYRLRVRKHLRNLRLGLRPPEKVFLNTLPKECISLQWAMRTYRRLSVRLSQRDRSELRELLRGGIQPVRTVVRALALLQLDAGQAASAVADNVQLTAKAVREIGRRYEDGGLERALYDQQRPWGHPAFRSTDGSLSWNIRRWRDWRTPAPELAPLRS